MSKLIKSVHKKCAGIIKLIILLAFGNDEERHISKIFSITLYPIVAVISGLMIALFVIGRSIELETYIYITNGVIVFFTLGLLYLITALKRSHDNENSLKKINKALLNNLEELTVQQEVLRESEKQYRDLFDSAEILIQSVSPDGHILKVNKKWLETLEYGETELESLLIWDLIHPKSVNQYNRIFQRILSGEEVKNFEVVFLSKNGTSVSVEGSANCKYVDNKPLYTRTIFRDLTERKQSEKALKQSEQRYRDLFNSISDFIYTHNLDGYFLTINPAAAETLGYSHDELIGKPISDFMFPEFKEDFQKGYLGDLREKGFSNGVSIYSDKYGTSHYIEYRSNLVKHEGQEPYVSGIGRDITEWIESRKEIKKMEKRIEHAERMESIGTLAGGIAHDFNNLLMGIQGNVSLILLDAGSFLPDHYEKLRNIEKYVQSGADLTKQLLGFARGGKYEVKPTDLNKLIEKSLRMFGRTKKEITLHSKYEKKVWIAEVDQGQIEQVLLNLYVNAWHAMAGGGNLFIETKNVVLDDDFVNPYGVEKGNYVQISLTDTGIGMDDSVRERIFDPFFTTKKMGRGTGLGLASVYGIVKNHSGIITVDSEPRKGSTFNIYMPASEKRAEEINTLDKEILKGIETVLLVDDEETILEVGKDVLEKLGYKVFIAKSGFEALEIYEKLPESIDIVVLDMIMPGIGGGETFDQLKKVNPKLKVLLSSGYSIDGQATEILKRGCDGFIQKPFKVDEISRKLREILEKPDM